MKKTTDEFLQHLLTHLKDIVADYLPKLTSAIVVLVVGIWLANRAKNFTVRYMLRRGVDRNLREFLPGVVGAVLKIAVIVSAAGMMGIENTSFIAVLGTIGLAIGMALQGSLANFAGGILILIFKPFRVGEVITAQDETGIVKEIQIFHTILVSPDNRTIVIPNGVLSNGIIENKTRIETERFDVTIVLDNNTDAKKALQLLSECCDKVDGILKSPSPLINITGFQQDNIELLVQPYVNNGTTGKNRSELISIINDTFNANDIMLAKTNVFVKQL